MTVEEAYRGKNVVVTGGAGFIGSNLATRLVNYGANVCVVDAYRDGCGANDHNLAAIRDQCRVVRCDIADEAAMKPVLQGTEFVFDLAGRVSHVDSMTAPHNDLHDNTIAHLSLLELVRSECPTTRFLYAGTRGQYGATLGAAAVDESHLQSPIDVNGAAKSAGEQLVLVYGRNYSIPVTSLRLTNTFGPRHQMKNGRHGVLNWFLRQLMEGETIRLYGGGDQIRDTNYVDDVVDAMCVALTSKNTVGQTYNLGGEPLSLKQYCELAIAVHGQGDYEVCEFPTAAKHIEIGDYVADIAKITKHTGWTPSTSIRDGLAKTFEYYRHHRSHYWQPDA